MERNPTYTADAGVEAETPIENTSSNGKGRKDGSGAASVGGFERDMASSTTEETPLLPSSGNRRDSSPAETWDGASDFIGLPWWKQPSILWLIFPLFLYAIAFGGIAVPRVMLPLKLICREYMAEKASVNPAFPLSPVLFGGDDPCAIPEVQAPATRFTLYTTLISGILSAIVSPKLGALSDRYGRKPILCYITIGGILSEVVTILAAKYPDTVHYSWMLLGSVFEGVCGSFIAGQAVTHSYAADCTAPPKRAVAFGYFQAALFGGIALGPLVAGYVIKSTGDVALIFMIALGCHVFYLFSVAFVIPESLSEKRQLAARERYRMEEEAAGETVDWISALRSVNTLAPLKILYPTGEGTSSALRANLILLSCVDTIIFGVSMSAMTVVIYYSNLILGWKDYEVNMFVSVASFSRVAALMIILPLLNYLVRTRRRDRVRRESGIDLVERNSGSDNLDLNVIRAGVIFELVGFAGYAVSRASAPFVMSGVFASIGGIASPTVQSALTKHVPHDRIGQLLGAVGLLHALARVVCPTIFSLIYAGTVKTFPQLVFILLAGFFGLGFICSCFVKPHVYLEEQGIKPIVGRHLEREDRAAERISTEEATGV